MKFCKKCSQTKDHSLFCKDSTKKDGLSYSCKECLSIYKRDWDIRHGKTRTSRQVKNTYGAHISTSDRQKLYYEENKKKIRDRQTKYRADKIDFVRALCRDYKKNNKAKIYANVSKRRALKSRATVSWANEFFIEEAYDLALKRTKATGIKFVVDHIYPLVSKQVCGLHVESNLQVIPEFLNARKSNKFPDRIGIGWGTMLMA